tara:strand:- start:153 stop:812 length:660 start_codon:yes stop_codon:yes gene_type:complete
MKEVSNSIYDTYKDRLKNPLFRSFLFSWIAFNWKPLSIIIVSKDSIYHRIEVIKTCYDPNWYNLIIPLAIAIAYILLLPYVMLGLDKLTFFAITRRRKINTKIRLNALTDEKNLIEEKEKIEESKKDLAEKLEENRKFSEETYGEHDYRLLDNESIYSTFGNVVKSLKNTNNFPDDLTEELKEYYLINKIVDVDLFDDGFALTVKGEWLYKKYFNEKFQ